MGQVNVNTPGGGTAGEPAGSSGAGFILGIIIAIIVIAVLVYMFVLAAGQQRWYRHDRRRRRRGARAERLDADGLRLSSTRGTIHTDDAPATPPGHRYVCGDP